ncbi:MAG: hypothetical protein GY940_41665 [bacterium]|nr:hypothetical protein [bacterium]
MAQKGFRGYPIATVACYGPDDQLATKVAVGIVPGENVDPSNMKRWYSKTTDVRRDPAVNLEILEFIKEEGAKSVVISDRMLGCPHEEGKDYPEGEVCPECPFWAHRDRYSGEIIQ